MKKILLLTLMLFFFPMQYAEALPGMDTIDSNNDGIVTWEEFSTKFQGVNKENFDAIDTDKNGTLNNAEMKEFRNRMGGMRPNSSTNTMQNMEQSPKQHKGLPVLTPKK